MPIKSKISSKKLPTKPVLKSKNTTRVPRKTLKFASLAEVRREIDDLDAVIAPLMSRRNYAVMQAAHFKDSVKGVVKLGRAEEIIRRVRRIAKQCGTDPDSMEKVYRKIIEVHTKDEQKNWRMINKR